MTDVDSPARTRLLVDVDTGIDDSLALVYLAASPEAEIVAVCCTAGNVPTAQVTRNTLSWLEICGLTDVEVAVGVDAPLVAPLMTTEDTHGPLGVGYANLPAPTMTVSDRTAAQAWVDLARENPGELVGLVTGPMTNLALALRLEPALPVLLKRLVIMGGSIDHPGNTTPTSEWNVAVDPEAAKEVFDAFDAVPSGREPIVCALGLTERIEMHPSHVARLAEIAGSVPMEHLSIDEVGARSTASVPVVRYLTDAVRFYMEFHHAQGEGYLAHMHDPFAAAVALHPEIAEYALATVDVELVGTLTRGTTVADRRGFWGRRPNAAIAVSTDPDAFFDHLLATVGAFAAGN
ncbi:nucleoside hydrolase [Rhodococcus sp. SORGH_AS_0301]|uniref:nucleoside hydrolase n=1 Tax=Rhodococcus sp. SORGH_AS_0301 TaxID=3041780 RepID=UPI0027839448|nr:nucleoside hydrolase [Rhodococcus sp. SORGH_AS_0301]MDQ1180390.1 purine nucleosidase [Rhodococcus sp. SORGH_AS_0301]